MTTSNRHALVIYAKAPVPGTVKTRLCPPLSLEEATALHSSFVMDTIERISKVLGKSLIDHFVACDPSIEHPFFKTLRSKYRIELLQQRGQDLGDRMVGTMQELFTRDYSCVIIIGSDLPTFPTREISRAFRLLDEHDCVLGPCPDGGYYLIGLRQQCPDLFSNIPWGTEAVLDRTKEKAVAHNLKLGFTDPCSDVDTPEDLCVLINEGNQTISKRTARLLDTLSSRLLV